MIDEATRRSAGTSSPLRADSRRLWWLAVFAVVLLVTTVLLAVRHLDPGRPVPVAATPTPSAEPTPSAPTLEATTTPTTTPTASPTTSPTTTPVTPLPPVLRLSGAV